MRTPRLVSLLCVGSLSACSLVLSGNDDEVQRCGNADECDRPEDNRFRAVCVIDDDVSPDDADKVCVAEFRIDVDCDPEVVGGTLADVFAEAEDKVARYTMDCTGDNAGTKGCTPRAGVCADGLEENASGFCDEPGAASPAIKASADLAGADVTDQFCRSYFCGESFRCFEGKCQGCDPDKAYEDGGCGTLLIEGEPSSVYQDSATLESECASPDSSELNVKFGPVSDPAEG